MLSNECRIGNEKDENLMQNKKEFFSQPDTPTFLLQDNHINNNAEDEHQESEKNEAQKVE